jgi:dTMP kinase
LLFQAARAQLYHEVVLPSLEKGKIVVMDRTRDSSVVYQGIVRKFGRDLIDQLNTISTQDTFPDKTLLLDVSVEIGLARRAKTGHIDRIDAENSKFHQQVRDAYLMLAQEDTTGRWVVIDAHQTVDEVEEAIWDVVAQIIAR